MRRTLVSSVAARFPRGFTTLALLLLIRERYGSYALAGVVVGVFAVANAASSPLQGRLIDRFGQPAVLIPSAVLHAALLVSLGLISPHVPHEVVLLTAGGAGVAVAPVSACTRSICTRSIWRDLVTDPDQAETVLAVDATSQELIWTLGPLVCRILAAAVSPTTAVATAAGMTVVATTVYATTPAARRWHAEVSHHRERALSIPALPGLLMSIALTGGCYGAVTVSLPAVRPHTAAGSVIAGLLLGMFSLGSLLGGLAYGSRHWRAPPAGRYRRLLFAILACTAPLTIVGQSIAWAVPLSLLAGVAWAPMLTCQYGLTGRLAAPGAMTETFTWMTAAFACGSSGGAAAAGALAANDVRTSFAFACLLVMSAAALACRQRTALDRATAPEAVAA
ncbi:MAG: MFS transporter [Solirubrobacteraceae bacterium]